MGSNPVAPDEAVGESENYYDLTEGEMRILEKEFLKKTLAKAQKMGKEGILIKKYVPVEKDTPESKEARQAGGTVLKKYLSKEEVEAILGDEQQQLEELTKTRGVLARAAKSLTDPAYSQRKKDLTLLKKKTTGAYRKKKSQQFAAVSKHDPGFSKRVLAKKGKGKKGTPEAKAQLRRDIAQRVGGYDKAEKIKTRKHMKSDQEERAAKKTEKVIKKKIKGMAKRKMKSNVRTLKDQGKKVKVSRGKVYVAQEADTEFVKSMTVFDECDADFSPYNQADVQDKTEKERDKRNTKKK